MNERLERLKVDVATMNRKLKKGMPVMPNIHPDDFRWLVGEVDRVEELERYLEATAESWKHEAKQKIRYAHALEEILKVDGYTWAHDIQEVKSKARKALEGKEDK